MRTATVFVCLLLGACAHASPRETTTACKPPSVESKAVSESPGPKPVATTNVRVPSGWSETPPSFGWKQGLERVFERKGADLFSIYQSKSQTIEQTALAVSAGIKKNGHGLVVEQTTKTQTVFAVTYKSRGEPIGHGAVVITKLAGDSETVRVFAGQWVMENAESHRMIFDSIVKSATIGERPPRLFVGVDAKTNWYDVPPQKRGNPNLNRVLRHATGAILAISILSAGLSPEQGLEIGREESVKVPNNVVGVVSTSGGISCFSFNNNDPNELPSAGLVCAKKIGDYNVVYSSEWRSAYEQIVLPDIKAMISSGSLTSR